MFDSQKKFTLTGNIILYALPILAIVGTIILLI